MYLILRGDESMLKKFPIIYRLFYLQLLINTILTVAYSFSADHVLFRYLTFFNILGLFILPDRTSKFMTANRIIQLFAQAMLIPYGISFFIQMTNSFINWNNPILIWLLIGYSLIMFVPYTYVLIVPFKNIVGRVILLIFSFVYTASSGLDFLVDSTKVASNPTIQVMSDSIFDGALIIMIMILIIMYEWGYGFPKYRLNKNAKLWIISLIVIFSTWFAMWNAFAGGNNLIASIYTFDFSNLKFSPTNILGGIEAGIAEEFIFRFGILTILLSSFYNRRNKYFYAAFISSLLFGLLHGMNALAGQSFANTIIQIIFAFSFGMYLAGIYLYTDLFYLSVFFHALIDTLVFLTTSAQVMTGKVTLDSIIVSVAESIVFLILGLLLIQETSQRKSKFELHFN